MNYSKLDWGLLLLRLIFGTRIVYGVIDNVLSWEQMIEFQNFLSANGFPFPLFCAVTSVYIQLLAGLSWFVGYQTRIASTLMIFNFLVAIIGFHLAQGDSYLGTAPALHLLTISILLLLTGPGAISVDQKLAPKLG
ncbi:MAG: DoxX family protein [Cyclobacteriaceae bacterium]